MRLTAQALDDNMLQSFLVSIVQTVTPQNARVAFQDFSQLLRYYPTSIYATDSAKRLVFLKDRLGGL